jgi:hypothetical protein
MKEKEMMSDPMGALSNIMNANGGNNVEPASQEAPTGP